MIAWLALVALAEPPAPIVPPRAIAPDFAFFEATLADAESTLVEVDALGSALALIHNRWAERQPPPPCDDAEARSLAARAPLFGAAYRDAVQAARVRSARLTRVVVSPVSNPLLGQRDRERADRVVVKTRSAARAYLETTAWQTAHLTPWANRCAPTLAVDGGLVPRAPRSPLETRGATAIIGIGGGRVCPTDKPADGKPVVVTGNVACLGLEKCDCAVRNVLPGAVLGP